jgi:hypothetical protein
LHALSTGFVAKTKYIPIRVRTRMEKESEFRTRQRIHLIMIIGITPLGSLDEVNDNLYSCFVVV